jgi:hypothetical protein
LIRLENNPNLCFDVQFGLNQYPLYFMNYAVDMLINENKLNMLFLRNAAFLLLIYKGTQNFSNHYSKLMHGSRQQ